jgi:S-adenosylmethionine hydrolase
VQEKSVLLYFNSIDTLSVAINTGNFAKAFNIASGYD